jgi:hypothetical protein
MSIPDCLHGPPSNTGGRVTPYKCAPRVFSFFTQRQLLKFSLNGCYNTRVMKPRLFCTPMLLRVHAAMLHALWSMVIRDQVPKRNRLPTQGNYVTQREQNAKNFTCILQCWDLLPTRYHVYQLQHTFMFTLQGT